MRINKILIIGSFPPPISGVSLANKIITDGLKKTEKWDVDIINSEYSKKIIALHGRISIKKFYFLRTYLYLYKVLFSKIIYISIGQSFFGIIKYTPFIILSKLLRKKLVFHLHGGHLLNEYNSLKGLKKKIFYFFVSKMDYGIVLSKSLRKNFSEFINPSKIFELSNFYESELKLTKQEIINLKDYGEIRIVFLSNLIEEKGINLLLEAIKQLYEKGIKIKIKVAGNIVSINDLSNYFGKYGVEYVGVVDGKVKKDFLLWGNVFCLPTFYRMEGQPISIIEAMATGNLIITTIHAGIEDICSSDNALFCNKNDLNNLVSTIEYLSNNTAEIKAKGLYNYDYAKDLFSQENFINNANKILLQCIN
jgi:glycosyltransferase involved in cell wall biosynthesis